MGVRALPVTLRCVRAEFTKLITLRLSLFTAVGTVVVTIAASWMLTYLIDAAHRSGRPEETAGLETGSAFLVVLHYGQIGVVLLAAWVMHQEAEPGSLRSTVISTPCRSVVLTAKGIVVASAAAVTALVCTVGSASARCAVIDCAAQPPWFAATRQDETVQLVGVVTYWVLIALFTYALAVLLRSGLAAMGVVLALCLAVSRYLRTITPLARFLPDQAGAQLFAQQPVAHGELTPLAGGLVLLAWTVVSLIGAYAAFGRQSIRD